MRSTNKPAKVGADDFLIMHGAEAFAELKDQAVPAVHDAARRQRQIAENKRIAAELAAAPTADKMSIEEMLSNFVFISDGSQVADIRYQNSVLKVADARLTYTASITEIESKTAKGDIKKKAVPTFDLWLHSSNRVTVMTRTFDPGAGIFCHNHEGISALNTYRPISLDLRKADTRTATMFVQHVRRLWREDADRFLDFLAHILQKPTELPHFAWLHISTYTGTGRNWIVSVLVRIFRHFVAPNVELNKLFDSQFNHQLAGKLLLVVDEIREGSADELWKHAQRLKSHVTEELRLINTKFKTPYYERNCCRNLFFSNHISAMPIDAKDRRINVALYDGPPEPQEYYSKLYKALEDRAFIAGVAKLLMERDLSNFHAGERAHLSEAKIAVIESSQSETMKTVQTLQRVWPCDLIRTDHLCHLIDETPKRLSPHGRRVLEEAGITSLGVIRIGKTTPRFHAIRNAKIWAKAGGKAVAKELAKINGKFSNSGGLCSYVEASAFDVYELFLRLQCRD